MSAENENPLLSPTGEWAPPEGAGPGVAPAPEPAAGKSYPEDIQTPWGWWDVVAFLFVAFFALMFAVVLLAPVFHFSPLNLPDSKHVTPDVVFYTLAVQVAQYVLALGYLFARIRGGFKTPFWGAIRWRRFGPPQLSLAALAAICASGGAIFSIGVNYASSRFGAEKDLPIEQFFQYPRSTLLLLLLSVLLAPLVEEIIFRGFLYPVLARSAGVAGGVLITGILFGLMHAPQLWGGWAQIALMIVVGIVFTYVRARTGSVAASYLVHLGYNSLLAAAFLVTTSGLRHMR